ncbi:MAG: hypothetical protein OEY22_10400 [Candidatus Bathyarchaeota archaeon]|nr:hypothetical protein [Candidatus Bathyarchaeota archaeon]MDH5787703.1 hypothetical protein [Candidatus Bathyarchaeota archaeon]
MGRSIEVYIRTERQLTHTPIFVQTDPGHGCTHAYGDGVMQAFGSKVEKVLPENEKQALENAKAVANDNGLEIKVYDLSTRVGRFKAQFKKVDMTPTVLFGGQRIAGNITKNSLLSIVKQYHS